VEPGRLANAPAISQADLQSKGPSITRPSPTQEAEAAKANAAPSAIKQHAVIGNTGTAYTDQNEAIEYQWAVVEVDALVISNDDTGRVNPQYPQIFQPRDRTSAGSEAQVNDIAKNANFDQLSLSTLVSDGAPIIGDDAVVESGNGRLMGLRRSYNAKMPNIARYKEQLAARADQFGLDPDAIRKLKRPVLVRLRTTALDTEQRVAFGQAANVCTVAPMREAEIAKKDAGNLTPEIFATFAPDEEGNLLAASNREFIRAFVRDVIPQNERPSAIDAQGNLSQSGMRRLRNALFVAAYGDSPAALAALARLTESTDDSGRNLINALTSAAPRFAEQKARMTQGSLHATLDITPDIIGAVAKWNDLKQQGTTVDDYLAQDQIPGIGEDIPPPQRAILKFIGENVRSARKLREGFGRYQSAVEAAGNPNQGNLFGESTQDKSALLNLAITAAPLTAPRRRQIPLAAAAKLYKKLFKQQESGQPLSRQQQAMMREAEIILGQSFFEFDKPSFAPRDDLRLESETAPRTQQYEQLSLLAPTRRAPTVTPAEDLAYMSAVEQGDMQTAQRMVDEAAKAAGYNTNSGNGFWRGVKRDGKRGELDSRAESYVTDDIEAARGYKGGIKGALQRVYIKTDNLLEIKNVKELKELLPDVHLENDYLFEELDNPSIRKAIWDLGYDSIKFPDLSPDNNREHESWLLKEEGSIKSANPVTRDAQGNVIPLSKRFDSQSNSILYSPSRRGVSLDYLNSTPTVSHDQAAAWQSLADLFPTGDGSTTRQRGMDPQTQAKLWQWGNTHGRITPESLDRYFDGSQAIGGGQEHTVVLDPDTQRIIKVTRPGQYGAHGLANWIHTQRRANEVFGDDIRIEGVVEDADDNVLLVISQPFRLGRPATQSEIENFLGTLGFHRVSDLTFYNPEIGEAIRDTQEVNVIQGEDGNTYPIDLDFFQPNEATRKIFESILRKRNTGSRAIAAAARSRVRQFATPEDLQELETNLRFLQRGHGVRLLNPEDTLGEHVLRFYGKSRERVADKVWDMLVTSYNAIGLPYRSREALLADDVDTAFWDVLLREGVPVSYSILKVTPYGYKTTSSGSDGSRMGKAAWKVYFQRLQHSGYYSELSGVPKAIAEKTSIPRVPAVTVSEILGKTIVPVDEYLYERAIKKLKKQVTKVMFGLPWIRQTIRPALPMAQAPRTSGMQSTPSKPRLIPPPTLQNSQNSKTISGTSSPTPETSPPLGGLTSTTTTNDVVLGAPRRKNADSDQLNLGLFDLLSPKQQQQKLEQPSLFGENFFSNAPEQSTSRTASPVVPRRPAQPAEQSTSLGELFDRGGGRRTAGTKRPGQLRGSRGSGNDSGSGDLFGGTGVASTPSPLPGDSETVPGLRGDVPSDRATPPPQPQPRRIERPAVDHPDRNFAPPANLVSLAPSGDKAKIEANFAAIELLKKLEDEGRNATTEEKRVLAAYTGWGAFKEAFNDKAESDMAYWETRPSYMRMHMPQWLRSWENNWRSLHQELKKRMSPAEYAAASRSTLNAHYTPAPIIRAMWTMVQKLGFVGGRALEPSAGAGHYIGLQPADSTDTTQWQAVELDQLSARLLAKLYPEVNVNELPGGKAEREVIGLGFERARIPNNSLDLVISNVPFHESGPRKKGFPTLNLHNFFFAHALDKVKPGGLVAFITSAGTMQNRPSQRAFIASKGDLVAAYRLPNNAFSANAGTEVVTDIIILRKPDGTTFKGEAWSKLVEVGRQTITLTKGADQTVDELRREAKANGTILREYLKDGVKAFDVDAPIMVNEYFANHPEHVLGMHSLTGSMYGGNEYTVTAPNGLDVAARLESLAQSLQPVMNTRPGEDVDRERAGLTIGSLEEGGVGVGGGDGRISEEDSGGAGDEVIVGLAGEVGASGDVAVAMGPVGAHDGPGEVA
jgi:hypothetical protein